MSSWRDEIPADLPREQMLAEAVERGAARRRRRQRREAALGCGIGLVLTVTVAMAAMSLPSRREAPVPGDVGVTGAAGADSSAGSTQQPGPLTGESSLSVAAVPTPAPPQPTTTVAAPPASVPRPAVGKFAGMSNPTTAPPNTTTTVPTFPPTTVGQPGAPDFVGASGNANTQRLMLRFTRPVVAGTAELAPMRLVVHGPGDSTCSSPTGNAHQYLDGLGTNTITTDATSLVIGTTYISIARGFVRNAQDGTENAPVGCVGIPVKG